MINKIKDFLKNKLSRRKAEDLSDQEEILDEEEIDQAEFDTASEDATGEFSNPLGEEDLPATPGFKEKFQDRLAAWKERIKIPKIKTRFKKPKGWQLPSPKEKSEGGPILPQSLGQSIDSFLSPGRREAIHQFALVVIISGITWTIGKMTALVLRDTPNLDTARDYTVSLPAEKNFNARSLSQIRANNPFKTNTGLTTKKTNIAEASCEEGRQKSSLPIKLVNTIVLQDSVKSLASVQVRGSRALKELREGDNIENLAKIFKIDRLNIVIKNLENGVCESIASDRMKESRSNVSVMTPAESRAFLKNKKMPGIENVGNKFIISKNLINEKMKDIASILTQARAIQMPNPDGTLSFKLTELDPEGIFPYLGLQDQDIITSINGKAINDINEVMGLFGRIKNLDNLQLGIKREGSETVQEYTIKK